MSRLLSRREFPLLLLVILLIAYGLRVFSLGDFALSWDEGYSTWIMRLPLATLLETTARDVHPPVYYLLLRGFTLAAGEGEFVGRYLSVLLGLITVALVYRLGHTVGGRWTGLVAAALTAIARANLTIAQDMRMHMLAMLFVTLLLWAALMVMRQPARRRWIVLYALAALGTLFTFYLAGMSLIVTSAAFAVWWWRHGRPLRPLIRWIAAHALIVGLFLPWGLYTYSQLLRGPSPEGMLSPLIYVQFYLVTLTMGFPTFDTAYVPFYLAVLIAVAAGVIVLLRAARRRVELSAPLALLLAGVIVPLAVVLVATIPFHSLARPVAARYFLSLSGAFYVLAAWAVVTL
ncbi:MAG TPA: glycosyltransferase family 39 protein, partial [Aggregatilineales bacterium]|nr:glycosyltransferase family 39 protein [Aggregatilineales bacterium]